MNETLSACPICNSSELEKYLQCKDFTVSKEIFSLVKCKSCGFVFTNPRPAESEIGKYYQSAEYVSHSDTKKGLINRLYHTVRKITLGNKLQLINSLHNIPNQLRFPKKRKRQHTALTESTSSLLRKPDYSQYKKEKNKWTYKIIAAETIRYSKQWKERLASLNETSAYQLALTHIEFGHYAGKEVKNFIRKNKIKADHVASHGHTVFHQPQKKLTLQIGSGAAIAAACGLPVICDFRSTDVAYGGQGAPLVPVGDKLLFPEYTHCLNLGGFANISFEHKGKRIAFDVCPVNIVMNELCKQLGKEFDDRGKIASAGNVNERLLKDLNELPYYRGSNLQPKSLGKEWVLSSVFPLIKKYGLPVKDSLRTFYEHVAIQITKSIGKGRGKVLASGGGTHNTFLIATIQKYLHQELIIPDKLTIDFKEALIFAFLGVLRIREENNSLSSVTGARKDSSGGCIYLP